MRSVASVEVLPSDDPWASYARTVVAIAAPGVTTLVVEAVAAGAGSWPWEPATLVHILTAWDPGDERPGESANRARQTALEADLRMLGPTELRTAVGVDPVSGRREEQCRGAAGWRDACRAGPSGLDTDRGAIFKWTPEGVGHRGVSGARRVVFG